MTTMPTSPVATSLKVPSELKRRLQRLAARTGESPHALMVRALAEHVEAAELFAVFVDDAARADVEMERSGKGYAMADVHRWVRSRVRGEKAVRPRAIRWRK